MQLTNYFLPSPLRSLFSMLLSTAPWVLLQLLIFLPLPSSSWLLSGLARYDLCLKTANRGESVVCNRPKVSVKWFIIVQGRGGMRKGTLPPLVKQMQHNLLRTWLIPYLPLRAKSPFTFMRRRSDVSVARWCRRSGGGNRDKDLWYHQPCNMFWRNIWYTRTRH